MFQVNFGDSPFMAFDSSLGPPKIQIELRRCDRVKLRLDFPALFMTGPGGTGTDVTVKVRSLLRGVKHGFEVMPSMKRVSCLTKLE